MAVRVLIKREVELVYEPQLHHVLLRLRAKAMEQEGYISGETLRSLENPNEILVISTWNKLADWKAWENSPGRKQIEKEIAGYLRHPESCSIFGYP